MLQAELLDLEKQYWQAIKNKGCGSGDASNR
jgi:hypothetical protein